MKPVILTIAAAALLVSGTIIWKDGQDAARLKQRDQAATKAREEAERREGMQEEVARQFDQKKAQEDARRKEWQDTAEHLVKLMAVTRENADATGKPEFIQRHKEAVEKFERHLKSRQ